MHTKVLMTSSAGAMLVAGMLLTFAPQEVLQYAGSVAQPCSLLAAQAAGALYLGFAMLNWMAKDNIIGGIYSRPVAMGNFLHFLVMAFAIIRAIEAGLRGAVLVTAAVLYAVFALWFGLIVFRAPSGKK